MRRSSECFLAVIACAGCVSMSLVLVLLHANPLPEGAEAPIGSVPAVAVPAAALRATSAASAAARAAGGAVARAGAALDAAAAAAVERGSHADDQRRLRSRGEESDQRLEIQIATLSQQVATLMSLVVQQQGQLAAASAAALATTTAAAPSGPPPTPPPPPPPPPPMSAWSYTPPPPPSPLDDTAKLRKEVDEMREELKRYSRLTDDRVGSLASRLHGGSTGTATAVAALPAGAVEEGHVCRSPPCSRDMSSCRFNGNCCSDFMFEMLVDFTDFLSRNNVTHFVTEGTLLGAVRDKDIIPYTGDLDIFVPREFWTKAKEIKNFTRDGKSYYFLEDPNEKHCGRVCAVWRDMPLNRAMYSRSFDWNVDRVGAEVQYYMDVYDEEMDFNVASKHLLYPLSNVTIRNRTFFAPREKELYVEARYGESWRTPDHESRELQDKYPTYQQAKDWSQAMLDLRAARRDAVKAHRLLERLTVEHRTNRFKFVEGTSFAVPSTVPRRVDIEADEETKSLVVVVHPPEDEEAENQVSHYRVFLAIEEMHGYDLQLKRLGDAVASAFRCGSGDPFAQCASRQTLRIAIPRNVSTNASAAGLWPAQTDATHVVVVAANENGDSSQQAFAELRGGPGSEARAFSRRVQLGLLAGLSEFSAYGGAASTSTCANATVADLPRSGIDDIVMRMVKKTLEDMTAALRTLGSWLRPVERSLAECRDVGALRSRKSFGRQRYQHLSTHQWCYRCFAKGEPRGFWHRAGKAATSAWS
eukprot:TRINITY_DN12741_c0_g1_i2.p1 TRINITY_DN12741_c0_g1~~TRINITY_DN12741_c0_g1_i2.p1  ORF type:complete len:757 (-),score=149.98 TRINITY_DN12741_c0_g1_i2:97-2367(-)